MYPSDDIQAELQDLWALVRLAQAGATQKTTPLVRTRWIDGDTTTPAAAANGSEGLPYASVTAFFTAVGVGKSVADTTQNFVGLVSPATAAAYTESPAIPPYRNVELRALVSVPATVTGNMTWANTAAAGGVFPPPTCVTALRSAALTGNFTYTDDAGAPTSEFVLSGDISGQIFGDLVATGAAGGHLAVITIDHGLVNGNLTSIASASGAIVAALNGATFNGNITCQILNAIGCTLSGGGGTTITTAAGTSNQLIDCQMSAQAFVAGAGSSLTVDSCSGGVGNVTGAALAATYSTFSGTAYTLTSTAGFVGCTFSGVSPVISGGTTAIFDGPSWLSFVENGGTVTAPMVALVIGGSQGALVEGAALTNVAALSLALNGVGATAGFTGGGNHYTYPTTALGQTLTITLLKAGAFTGDTMLITRQNFASAQTIVVQDDAATLIATLPVSSRGFVLARYNGTHFTLAACGAGVTA